MAIPANVARVVIGGSVDGGEEWSTGFWVSSGAPAQTILDAIDNEAVEPWWDAVSPTIYAAFHFSYIKVYAYAAGGSSASSQAEKSETGVGQKVNNGGPYSTAMVVTTQSATPGRSGRGRLYVPYHETIAPSGHFPSQEPGIIGGAVNTMLSTIRGNADGITPVIVSRTHTVAHPITSVRADDLPDTQRRRDESLTPGTVYSAPLASA